MALTGKEILYVQGVDANGAPAAGTEQTTTAAVAALSTSKSGTVVINGATPVVVANTNIDANSVVVFTLKTIGGTPAGSPFLSSVTPGTGFSVEGFAGDTSTYNYVILN